MENSRPAVKVVYKNLQERLDKYPIGAPPKPEFFELLQILFDEEHARVASLMPIKPSPIDKLSKRTGVPEDKLRVMFEKMAGRGLVMDFKHGASGKTYYMLAPTIVGFFEFSLMKERDDFDQKRVAELMDKYEHGDFATEVFQGRTQIGRALASETALDESALSTALDNDRASKLIESAGYLAVSHCFCRHKTRLMGKPCGKTEEICLALGQGSDFLVRNKLAREISVPEALDLLEQARSEGLVQIADNIASGPTFICNCCGCCCAMLRAINDKGLTYAVHTSGFIASVKEAACTGCSKCKKICPVNAISISEEISAGGKKIRKAVIDEQICLGCGVCERSCNFESLWMRPREKRTLTPANTLERILMMAVERGKLHHVLFDGSEGPTADFLKNITGAFLNMPVSKRLLLNKEIQSRFLEFANKATGRK
ncbi:MAG: 4Fe-4S dicluster domain-containing protein [bacterium]